MQEICNDRALFETGTVATPKAFKFLVRKPNISLIGYCGWATDWGARAEAFSRILWMDIGPAPEYRQVMQLQWTCVQVPINWKGRELIVLEEAIEEATGRNSRSASSSTVNLTCSEAKALIPLGVFLVQKLGELLQSHIPQNLHDKPEYNDFKKDMEGLKKGMWARTDEHLKMALKNYCESSVAAECWD
jgi:hypothetical protein